MYIRKLIGFFFICLLLISCSTNTNERNNETPLDETSFDSNRGLPNENITNDPLTDDRSESDNFSGDRMDNDQMMDRNFNNDRVGTDGLTDDDLSNEDIADHLSIIAGEVPDVDRAVAIVAGPYAVVGITLSDEVESERVGTVKYSVSEALKNDRYGKTAVVIANADVTNRISEMTTQIQDGHPIKGVVNELAEIVSRFMPTFPVDENRPDEDGNLKRQMNELEQNGKDNQNENKKGKVNKTYDDGNE